MTDAISSMSDSDLRRAIAEALGWRVVIENHPYFANTLIARFYNPNGQLVESLRQQFDWQCDKAKFVKSMWNSIISNNFVPNWPQDANAALGLLRETDYSLTTWFTIEEEPCWLVFEGNIRDDDFIAQHESAPRAVSEAWYRWHLAQTPESGTSLANRYARPDLDLTYEDIEDALHGENDET